MNLELTIQDMFDNYPTLFKDRSDCLNHLFCTIGNGYHWCDGELIGDEESSLELLEKHLVNGKAYQHNKLSLRAEAQYYFDKAIANGEYSKLDETFLKELLEARRKTILKLPDNVYHRRERQFRWYFYLAGYCFDFAYLFNYPENIKPDWQSGIEECKKMLIEDGYDIERYDDDQIDFIANQEEMRESMRQNMRRNKEVI